MRTDRDNQCGLTGHQYKNNELVTHQHRVKRNAESFNSGGWILSDRESRCPDPSLCLPSNLLRLWPEMEPEANRIAEAINDLPGRGKRQLRNDQNVDGLPGSSRTPSEPTGLLRVRQGTTCHELPNWFSCVVAAVMGGVC